VAASHGRFAWYELVTVDVAAARAFYTRVMGWEAHVAPASGRPYTLFAARGVPVAGLMGLPEDAGPSGAKPSWLGYVGVDDVDIAADRVRRLGGNLYVPPTSIADISRFAVFADPQGAPLALFKWLRPGAGQTTEAGAPGRVGWHELIVGDRESAAAFFGELFGWRKVDADDGGDTDFYQLFAAGGQMIGGMLTKPPTIPAACWLYYFNVGEIDAAAQRVNAGGGQILFGPIEVPGGSWIIQCADPQGAIFALEGKRTPTPIGYFQRSASGNPSAPGSRRWSW
jgi:predicted enzyme related to lactoylglutathione lyase